ncbi:MAG: DUF934 domain-containing protein [Pseudomonas sp.]|uniref:DUF934 domain-containing protein n=1 Tax=Pseudomonas sp. TaxID=306 RepID=UPI0030F0783F
MNNLIRLVDGQAVIDRNDAWQLGEGEGLRIVHSANWQAGNGLLLSPDDDVESLHLAFAELPLIAIDFPSFRDGRGYSQAYLLRSRLGWQGELRAVGDVLRDQLSHMRQCGFDSFAVREDKSVEDALKGLAGMSVLYGRSAIEPRPLFRRSERV